MAISTAMATSFKVDLLDGTFGGFVVESPMNNIKIALFTSAATLDATTTAYSSTNEVANGNGYTTGGQFLVVVAPTSSSTTAFVDFADVVWTSSTITANGCLIYDATNSNAAISSHAFGSDKSSSSGDFTVVFPTADASNAIIRIA
jgi:hypothetical protein